MLPTWPGEPIVPVAPRSVQAALRDDWLRDGGRPGEGGLAGADAGAPRKVAGTDERAPHQHGAKLHTGKKKRLIMGTTDLK